MLFSEVLHGTLDPGLAPGPCRPEPAKGSMSQRYIGHLGAVVPTQDAAGVIESNAHTAYHSFMEIFTTMSHIN